MKDLTGSTLGKYQVLERLGRGGMADVYRAYQPGMDRYVAIKVLHGHLAEDTGFIARFKREAQSVGTLRHPNIVQVIDFDAVDDEYYMVMEFIDGDTLKAKLSKQGALPVADAIALMVKIADAVAYAHRAGMIHRDIKPANIMMTTAGEPILTDFGIAKILSATNLTATGVAVGTPAYMSPEAGRGEKVDERADIYSLGIMLYEMVTGTVPFDADTPWAVILKHINEPLPRPTAVLPTLPQSVERILLKSLTKAPDDRYQTASDFRDALVKAGQTLNDPQPAVSIVSDSPTTQVAKKTEASAPPPKAKSGTGRLIFGLLTLLLVIGAGAFYVVNQQVISNSPDKQTATALALLPNVTATSAASPTTEATATTASTETPTTAPTSTPTQTVVPTNTTQPTSTPTTAPTETIAPSATPITQPTDAPTTAPTTVALNTENTYDQLSSQIFQMVNDGLYDAALDEISLALSKDPQNYILQQLQAYVLVQYREDGEKLEMAKQIAEAGVEAYPDRPQAYYVLAQYWGASPQDDYQKALDLTTQAIDKGLTNSVNVYLFHGTMLYYVGGSSESILTDFDKAMALEPNNESLYRRRGFYLLDDLYELEKAQADFEKALELRHDNIYEVGAALAWIYIKQDTPDKAFELYRKSIEEDVISNASYLADGALVAWQTGHLPEAEKWATDAQAIDPTSNVAKYAVALVAWAKDEDENALKILDEIASSSEPDSYHQSFLLQWYHLGRELEMDRAYILIELDRKDEAIDALKTAVEHYNSWLDPYLQLGKLYTDQGNKDEARAILQRGLEVATNQKDAEAREQILTLLKELGS